MALAWAEIGGKGRATTIVNTVLETAGAWEDKADAVVRSWLAKVWAQAEESEKAVVEVNSAWQAAKFIEAPEDKVDAMCAVARAFMDLGQTDNAIAAGKQAVGRSGND